MPILPFFFTHSLSASFPSGKGLSVDPIPLQRACPAGGSRGCGWHGLTMVMLPRVRLKFKGGSCGQSGLLSVVSVSDDVP